MARRWRAGRRHREPHAGQWCQGRGWVLEDPGLHAGRLAVLVLIDDGSGRQWVGTAGAWRTAA